MPTYRAAPAISTPHIERRLDTPRPGPTTSYVWMQYERLCQLTGMRPRYPQFECCACHQTVPLTDTYSAVAVDTTGRPRSGYLHCTRCMLTLGAGVAWHKAKAAVDAPQPSTSSVG